MMFNQKSLNYIKNNAFGLILIVSCIYILGNIASGSLNNLDEAVYANVARETAAEGSWLVPRLGGSPWLEKPFLYMWLTAQFYQLFGLNEWSVRLTSGLLGVACVLLTYLFGTRLRSKNTGIFAALTLLAMPPFFHFSKQGMLDVPLTFGITLMLYLFWLGQKQKKYLFLSGLIFSLAYFMKGYAALMGPGVIMLYSFSHGKIQKVLNRHFILGFTLSVCLIFFYHLYQAISVGTVFTQDYLGTHVFRRVFQGIDGHNGDFTFYFHVLKNKAKPWSWFLAVSLPYLCYLVFKKRNEAAGFVLSWTVVVFLFCTLTQTKLYWYVMPIYPALSISIGIVFDRFFQGRAVKWGVSAIFAAMFLQTFFSPYYNLDFNPDVKEMSGFAKGIHSQGNQIYIYQMENVARFYTADFGIPLFQAQKLYEGISGHENIYFMSFRKHLEEISRQYDITLDVIYESGRVVITKLIAPIRA